MNKPVLWIVGGMIRAGVCVAEVATSPAPDASATNLPVRVFILAGQSNAVGYNDHRQYRRGASPMPDELLRQPEVLFWNAAAGAWTTLEVGRTEGFWPQSFGPEIGFAHDLALRPGERVAIIKVASGGTGIARSRDYNDYIPSLAGFDDKGVHWHPPAAGEPAGELYQKLVRTVGDALATLDRDGQKYEVSAFLWMQGEHEAGISPRMAGDYAVLLKSFMSAVRADLNTPRLPFAVGEVNSHTWAFGERVRKAQGQVCSADPDAALVKTTDLSRQGSGGAAHFDAEGMLELGARFAAAVNAMRSTR